jgi:hypothetical protein
MSGGAPFLLLFLLVFLAIWVVNYAALRDRPPVILRRIVAYDIIRDTLAEAAEDGRPVHLSLGTAGITDVNSMQTMAALTVLDYLSEQAVATTNMPLVTTANPTTLLLANNIASRPFEDRGRLVQFDAQSVRFMGGVGETAVSAYTAGVLDLLDRQAVTANFMLGHFGDECVVIGEQAARNSVLQVAGSGDPSALALMSLTADHLVLGEELFAAGAYLSRLPWHVSGLLAQDSARWIFVVLAAVVVALKTLGLA